MAHHPKKSLPSEIHHCAMVYTVYYSGSLQALQVAVGVKIKSVNGDPVNGKLHAKPGTGSKDKECVS